MDDLSHPANPMSMSNPSNPASPLSPLHPANPVHMAMVETDTSTTEKVINIDGYMMLMIFGFALLALVSFLFTHRS